MISNRLAFAALGIACVAAAAGGGYLATRDNAANSPATSSTPATAYVTPADQPLPPSDPAPDPVVQSQATPTPAAPAPRTSAPAARTAAASKTSPASASKGNSVARVEQPAPLPE